MEEAKMARKLSEEGMWKEETLRLREIVMTA
jgi:hypothetical protein